MATLTGRSISGSYTELLKTTSASGITSSLDTVQDGDGTDSVLQLSTTGVKSTGTLEVAGITTATGGVVGDLTGDVAGDLTGNVTATSVLVDGVIGTTQSADDNSTKVATTAYVDAQVETSDTLSEVLANGGTATSSALAGVMSDETGSGSLVFATSPTLVTPALGTPASGVATNLTGTAASLTAGTVTTNANLTGDVTSSGNATTYNNVIPVAKGGTTLTGFTAGDVLYADTTTTLAKLAKGSDTEVLTLASGVPSWAAPTTGDITGVTAGTNLSGGGTSGDVTLNLDDPVVADVTGDVTGDLTGNADTVTTNANLTGDVTSVGNATTLGTVAVAKGGTNLTSYATGDVLYATGSTTLAKLAKPGTPAGEVLTFATSASAPSWVAPTTGDITGVTAGTNLNGGGTSGTVTLNLDNPVVANLTGNASGSSGSCTGNAATATLASTVTVTDSTADTAFPVVFHDESNALLDDTGAFTYNPSTGHVGIGAEATGSNTLVLNDATYGGSIVCQNSGTNCGFIANGATSYGGGYSADDFNIMTQIAGSSLILGTVSTARMWIDSAGLVGIGTAAPATKLTVEGSVTLKEQAAADADTAAYGQLWVKTGTPNTLYFTDDAGTDTQLGAGGGGGGNLTTKGDLEVYTTSQTRLGVGDDDKVLTADASAASGVAWKTAGAGSSLWTESGDDIYYDDGNVGIGTTSPGAKLDVKTGNILLSSDSIQNVQWESADNNFHSAIRTAATTGDMDFWASKNGSTAVMTLHDGNVGIGTAAPSRDLHVVKAAETIIQAEATDSGGLAYLIALGGHEGSSELRLGDNHDGDIGKIQYDHSSDFMAFTVNAAERMRIDSDGNVGIGTDTPVTKLTVEGTVTLKEQAAADSDTAAYGQVWVKTATPNELWFTDDAGTDDRLGTAMSVTTVTSGNSYDVEENGQDRMIIINNPTLEDDFAVNLDGAGTVPAGRKVIIVPLDVQYNAYGGSFRINVDSGNIVTSYMITQDSAVPSSTTTIEYNGSSSGEGVAPITLTADGSTYWVSTDNSTSEYYDAA